MKWRSLWRTLKVACYKNKSILVVMCIFMSFKAFSKYSPNPQFSDYQVSVSNGPFEKKIHFNKEQESYSSYWKISMQKQLNESVNFAGHFIIYTAYGGHGKECVRDNWVCGWVIDKETGRIVATLPADDNGSNSYFDISDNGTPVGLPFKVETYKNSSIIAIIGQSTPQRKNDNPVCKTILYNFTKGKYMKLRESLEGCHDK
ncbi:hypothetical protein G9X53_05385 [Cronobacter dublinensis]|nr:hypothetical protein [Cronobacter dublinensis]